MKTIVVIDNQPSAQNSALECEHGLSFYVEAHGSKILIDTGASNKFAHNATKLAIDLSTIDYCVISHAHKDHSGGLSTFIEQSNSKIYLSKEILQGEFYSSRGGERRHISPDKSLFTSHPQHFEWVEDSVWLTTGIALIKCHTKDYPTPYGNIFQSIEINGTHHEDNYDHELAVAIVHGDELIIFSPCSHSGVFNIISAALQFTGARRVSHFIGGLHIVDSTELEHEVALFKSIYLARENPPLLYTGHCTNPRAIALLSPLATSFCTGYSLSFAIGDRENER